jgi:hypothetical protein
MYPVTAREQFNMALTLFKKMAETLSGLTSSDFQQKLQFFLDIHDLIKRRNQLGYLQRVN